MTARTFVFGRLTSYQPLTDLITGIEDEDKPRVFAKKTMTSSEEEHPYLVYKLGNSTAELLSEADGAPDIDRQYLQIWVHDYHDHETGDYMEIDKIVQKIKEAFKDLSSKDDNIWAFRYLETSQDLNDDTLNTLFRYVRFQIIKEET